MSLGYICQVASCFEKRRGLFNNYYLEWCKQRYFLIYLFYFIKLYDVFLRNLVILYSKAVSGGSEYSVINCIVISFIVYTICEMRNNLQNAWKVLVSLSIVNETLDRRKKMYLRSGLFVNLTNISVTNIRYCILYIYLCMSYHF